MKTKITFILLLLLFVMGGSAFAQVQINAPTAYQPVSLNQGGAPGTYKVDIVNNNPAALTGATFSLSLPAGMEYVAGTITGATQLSIANLQTPTFTLNSIPIGNTLQITFSARINCGFSTPTINYSVISGGSTVATGSSAVAGNTPAPAYALSEAPNPQVLSTLLKTNASRTIKFRNSGVLPVTTVYIESVATTASQASSYKVMSANNGVVSSITNGYRITLTGTTLQNAVTTAVGAANTSFDPGEEITVVLTEQMLSCATGTSINLNMKAGSGDTKGSLCFFDSSTAAISTTVGNPSISLTRRGTTTYPTFCTNGVTSYTITNGGTGNASSALHDIKLPWSVYRTNSGILAGQPSDGIILKKVTIGGVDVTAQVLTKNGTGSSALIAAAQNVDVINLASLTSSPGTAPLADLDGDGHYDDLMPGQSFQIDFEYGFDLSKWQSCLLQSSTSFDDGNGFFNLGTSYKDQCGTVVNKFNYSYTTTITDNNFPTFAVQGTNVNNNSATIQQALFHTGDKSTITVAMLNNSYGALYSVPFTKTFTIVMPDGLDYDATGDLKYGGATNPPIVPKASILYSGKTLTITMLSTASIGIRGNDYLTIPVVAAETTLANKTVSFQAAYSQNNCPGISRNYGCGSTALNYAFATNCSTVGTTNFKVTRTTFGFAPDPSGNNVYYHPTAFVDENTPGINLQGAYSKDKVRFNIDGKVNSTVFSQLWARVKYTTIGGAANTKNFIQLAGPASTIIGSLQVKKASDASVLSTNITVGDLVLSFDSTDSKQQMLVNVGAKIGPGLDINYSPAANDEISINWEVQVDAAVGPLIYSAIPDLAGEFFTKDTGGIESGCQPLPGIFSLQRFSLGASNFYGTTNMAGDQTLSVQSGIVNGVNNSNNGVDKFPNEVRMNSNIRSTTITVPGIWVFDTTANPYYSVSGVTSPLGRYNLDFSQFNLNYVGGNTVITYTNPPFGVNGFPDPNGIPAHDNVSPNGVQRLYVPLKPVCVANGSISVVTTISTDTYVSTNDPSIVSSATYGPTTVSGVSYINYTATTVPTLQNVDGIGSTVNWQVKVTNTTNIAAIEATGVSSALPNNWMSFTAPNNNITVTKLVDISNGTEYPALSYGAGKYWVKLGSIATSATYNVVANYTACTDDKLNFTYSFAASGYPVNPDEALGAAVGVCAASQTTFDLNLKPKDIALSMTVMSPANPVQFCTNTTAGEHLIDYTASVSNTAVGNAENLIFQAVFPAGYAARTGTSKLTYNGTTKILSDPVYNSANGMYEWNISTDPNGTPFLPGAASGANSFIFTYQGETSCGFVSGTSVNYTMRSTSGCGKVIEYKAAGSAMELSMKPSSLNTYYLAPGVVNLKNDGTGSAYQIEVTNQGTQPLQPGESIFITMPKSIDYVAGSVVRVSGASNVGEPLSNTILGNNRILKFPLPTGTINPATLGQNETAKFSIQLKIVDPAPLSCGVTADAIILEAIYSVPGVMCGASPCDISVITGNVKSDINATKTSFTITPTSGVAKYASSTNNDVIVKYTVKNTGTIANSTPIIVDFFNDLNKDGVFSGTEPILYTQTIGGGAQNLAAGAVSAEQTTATFTVPESAICNLAAVIRLANNTEVCADASVKTPLKFESATTAFSVCAGSNVTIGNPSNGATISWSPATYLSDATISNPVFNYNGATLTVPTDFTYTATITHTGGCIDTYTNVVTVNPLPLATIAYNAVYCKTGTASVTQTGTTGGTYTGDAGLVINASTGAIDLAASTIGNHQITYTFTQGACQNTATAVIRINPVPTATVSGTTAVCKDSAVQVITFTGANGTAPYTFTYNINNGSNLTVSTVGSNTAVNVPVSTATAGVFTYNLVSIKDSSTTACEQTQTGSAAITVNPLPTATITGTTAVCQNAAQPNITFTGANGTAPYTFKYKIDGGSDLTVTTTSGNSVTVPVVTDNVATYTYTLVSVKDASSTACEQVQTGTATVTVNPLPTATISGATAVCQNAAAPNVTFTGANGTAPYTFTYKINGGADQTLTTAAGNSVTVAQSTAASGSFEYTLVSVKDASSTACVQNQTGSAIITVNPLPTATIAGTATVCQNGTVPNVTFTGANGSNPYTFTYKVNGGADQTVTTTVGSSVTVSQPTGTAGTFTYTLVSVKDGSTTACEQVQTGTATVTVNALPTATISGTATVCQNAVSPNVTFTGAGGTAPYTFTYKVNGGADQTVTTTAGNSVDVPITTSATGSFTYTLVKVKDSNATSCEQAQTGSAAITINENAGAAISGSAEVCQNAAKPNVTFTGSGGTAPYTFTYNVDGGATQTIVSTGDTATIAVETSTVGTITYNLLSVSDSSVTGCGQTQTGSAVVKINPLPTATIAGAVTVCQNAASPNVTFTGAGGTAPYTFTYKVNGGADQTVTTVTGSSATVAQATGTAGTFTYALVSVKEGSATGCAQAQTGSAAITVNALPTATIAGTATVCKDDTAPNVTFTGTGGTAPYTFTYKVNGGADQTVTTVAGSSVTVAQPTATAGTFTYTLVSVKEGSSTGCEQAQTGSAVITVNPLPTATIAGTVSVCKDGTAPNVTFTGAGGTAPYTFTYKVNGGADQTVTTTAGSSVDVQAPTDALGDFTYTLVSVKDSSVTGCEQAQTGSAVVTVNALLALNGTESTLCAADGTGYVLSFSVTGQAPYAVTGTGAPGTWSGNDWTSDKILAGTDYNISVQDAYACNTVTVAGTAPICCVYEVTAPTFPATTVACYSEIPTAATLTKAEYEALGNADGRIGDIPCGVIEITASNSPDPGCNGNVIRTYTVTEYADPNNNKVRDAGEDTVLHSTSAAQTFTIAKTDFAMPADAGMTVNCIADAVAPVVPTVVDNCGNALTPSAPAISAAPACNGVETYTYTFTDCAGHTHDWVYTYTINNTVAPQGTAPADITVQCIGDIPAADARAAINVTGSCNNNVTVTVEDTNNGGAGCSSNPYIVTRTYTLTDCGGLTTKLVQTITAIDTTKPVFAGTLPTDMTLECTDAIPAAPTLAATDNCSAAAVTFSEVKVNGSCPGNYQLVRTWTAADACGNTAVHTQTINVADTKAPVFAGALPEKEVSANCTTIPAAAELTATDECSNAKVTFSEERIDGSCSGIYKLVRTWTAEDDCGNQNIFTQTVDVSCLNVFNGLSPNGDGINDTLEIGGIDCFPNNSVKIYNRYGVLVYEKNGYDNVTNPFAGLSDGRATVIKGDKLPTGTYFYTLEYDDNGKQVQKSGYIYISAN